jgi:hypothetical protein
MIIRDILSCHVMFLSTRCMWCLIKNSTVIILTKLIVSFCMVGMMLSIHCIIDKFVILLIKIVKNRLNTWFGPLTYFLFSIWSPNYKVSQFGPINLTPFTIMVIFVSILQNLLTSFDVSFKIDDQRLNLKSTYSIPCTRNLW